MEKVDPDSGCKMVAIFIKTEKNMEKSCYLDTIYTHEVMKRPQYMDDIVEYE